MSRQDKTRQDNTAQGHRCHRAQDKREEDVLFYSLIQMSTQDGKKARMTTVLFFCPAVCTSSLVSSWFVSPRLMLFCVVLLVLPCLELIFFVLSWQPTDSGFNIPANVGGVDVDDQEYSRFCCMCEADINWEYLKAQPNETKHVFNGLTTISDRNFARAKYAPRHFVARAHAQKAHPQKAADRASRPNRPLSVLPASFNPIPLSPYPPPPPTTPPSMLSASAYPWW
jgi:hypothetical protein